MSNYTDNTTKTGVKQEIRELLIIFHLVGSSNLPATTNTP
jgi:hypothetical protein